MSVIVDERIARSAPAASSTAAKPNGLDEVLDQAGVGTWILDLQTHRFHASESALTHLALLSRRDLNWCWRAVLSQGKATGRFDLELAIDRVGQIDSLQLRGLYDAESGLVRGLTQDCSSQARAQRMAQEQSGLIESVVRGLPAEECLLLLTQSIARLQPGVRACVVMANAGSTAVERVISAQLGEAFGHALMGAPIGMPAVGTCAEAILLGTTVECANISASDRWASVWKELCLSHGVFSCASVPVTVKGGANRASLFLCLPYARPMDPWERQIAGFGAFIASLVLEREVRDAALAQSAEKLAATLSGTERERRKYETFLDSSADFAFVFDLQYRFTYANRRLLQLLDRSAEQVVGKRCDQLDYPDWQAQLHRREIDSVAATGESIRGDVLFDGAFGPRMYEYIMVPLFDEAGQVEAVAGTTRDVTERKQLEEEHRCHRERLHVLVGELQHRTRNILAVVAAISKSTLSSQTNLAEGASRLDQRLKALSRAYTLLSQLEQTERVCFDTLLKAELAAHCDIEAMSERLELDGPEGVALQGSVVQALALALHELATNAVKYGALGADSATLKVHWALQSVDSSTMLRINWDEYGVCDMPDPADPARGGGAGRSLIERALPYQTDAKVSYSLEADGVRCQIMLPLPQQQREGARDCV